MDSNTPNNKFFRTAITVVITAILQSIIFCLILGLPLPQFFSSRDVESLQFQQLPDQKRSQPVEALEEVKKPKARPAKRSHSEEKPVAETAPAAPVAQPSEQPTKVLVVNFEKSKDEDKKEEPKAQEVVEQKSEEKPKLVPVSDKLADVQSEDTKTEAGAAVTESPTEGDSSAAVESMEKSN